MLFHTVCGITATDSLKLIPISDTHIGDPCYDEDVLLETIYQAKHDNVLLMLNGDIVNNAVKSSISNCYDETMKPREQVQYAAHIFGPVKDKIIGAVEGNHERRSTREVDQSPTERYCEKLGIKYFGDEVLLKFSFGARPKSCDPVQYSAYFTHGFGGGRMYGGKINNLSRLGDIVISDIYCMAHTHSISAHPEIIFLPDMRTCKVNEFEMMYISSGGYLRRGGYSAQKGYAPLKLGSPIITMSGREKSVKVTL